MEALPYRRMDRARPDLRPLAIGEMVDGALRLFRSNFLTLIKISAMVMVPIAVIQLIATVLVGPVDLQSLTTLDPNADIEQLLAPFGSIYAVLGITSVLSMVGSVIVQGASITAFTQAYQGQEPEWRTSLRAGIRRFWPLLAATLLITIGSAVGLIFCIVPGVFLFTVWSVAPAALVAEQKGPVAAMSRSGNLVRGRFWPVLGAIFLAYLLYLVASQVVSALAGVITILGTLNTGTYSFIPTVVGSSIVSVLASPFLAAMVTIIYFDLRVRKEGYDLELMAADLQRMSHEPEALPRSDDHPFGLDTPGDQ